MTNEEFLQEMKIYIDLKFETFEINIGEDWDNDLKCCIQKIFDERTRRILDAISNRVEKIEDTIGSHETRIKKLETRAA